MSGPATAQVVHAALHRAAWLGELGGQRVTVVIPDGTRPLPMQDILHSLLSHLASAQVTVLLGLGLHRPLSDSELAPLEAVCQAHGANLVQHDPHNAMQLVTFCTNVGGLSRPLPASLHGLLSSCDARILVGIVEPHQYAGFSGGAKGVAIGCAGAATIGALHGLELLKDPGTRLGQTQGNRFHAALWRIVAGLEPMFGVQVVPTEPPQAFVGRLAGAYAQALEAAQAGLFVDHDRRYPAVVTTVGPSKAQSFYQASRAATYVAEVGAPVLEEGGAIILEAACPEGLGQGAGELAFASALEQGPKALLQTLEQGTQPLQGGEQRAYLLARVLSRFRLALVGAESMPVLKRFGVVQSPTVAEAMSELGLKEAPERLRNVFHRVPRYRGAVR